MTNSEVDLESPTDGVLVITINRPAARNAVDSATARAIAAALDTLDGDVGLRVGILTGAGGTFSAGMDLKAFMQGDRPVVAGRGFAGIVERGPAKPLIAAVEGFALAGGFEVALACDLIVAAEGATFGIPEVTRGLVAAGGGLLRLPMRIPYHHAMELALLGNRITASHARELGLVNRLVPDGSALAGAMEIAQQICANGPLAVAASKKIIAEAHTWPADEMWERQAAISAPVAESGDAREGATAFAEKRSPRWRNA